MSLTESSLELSGSRARKSPAAQDARLLALMQRGRFGAALALSRGMTRESPEHGLGWKIFGVLLWSPHDVG